MPTAHRCSRFPTCRSRPPRFPPTAFALNGHSADSASSHGASPNGPVAPTRPWLDAAAPPQARATALLAAMTTQEKVAQLVGVWANERDEHQAAFADGSFLDALRADHPHGFGSLTRPYGSGPTPPAQAAEQVDAVQRFLVEGTRLGIPALVHEECLTGLMAPGATILPSALAWGATFSPEHVRTAAAAVGQQLAGLGIHLGLAPVLDVARDHRFGRVEECIGEDPLLVATLGAAYVSGLQSAGVGACAKHFVGHAAPEAGHNTAPVHAGWRELSDTHLPPFAAAVTAGVAAVMSGYHDIDGDPVTGSSALLDGLLRRRLHFDGPVVSDYWALNFLVTAHHVAADREQSAALALAAGVDLELPRPDHFPALVAAVDAGRVPVALLDAAVTRVLTLKFRLGLFEHPYCPDPHVALDPPAAREAARALAERSVTLLHNDGVLPLPRGAPGGGGRPVGRRPERAGRQLLLAQPRRLPLRRRPVRQRPNGAHLPRRPARGRRPARRRGQPRGGLPADRPPHHPLAGRGHLHGRAGCRLHRRPGRDRRGGAGRA